MRLAKVRRMLRHDQSVMTRSTRAIRLRCTNISGLQRLQLSYCERMLSGDSTAGAFDALVLEIDRAWSSYMACKDRPASYGLQMNWSKKVSYTNSSDHRRTEFLSTTRLRLVAPAIVNRTVRSTRRPNRELRSREHLTEAEIEKLLAATRGNRYGHRDATMLLVAYRHGLRSSELVDLRWEQVDFASAILHVRRVKHGTPATHPIVGDELRALRRLQREQEPRSPFLFTSERGAPFTTAGFARMVERAGRAAGLPFKAHPHMLRHACGFALANKGHDTRALQAYLGHKNIQHTVRYTELAPTRFKNFWR
jgi:type 1 fimbriae regulatory protein FimB/type 1 fimbriae regulatory protein FimE